MSFLGSLIPRRVSWQFFVGLRGRLFTTKTVIRANLAQQSLWGSRQMTLNSSCPGCSTKKTWTLLNHLKPVSRKLWLYLTLILWMFCPTIIPWFTVFHRNPNSYHAWCRISQPSTVPRPSWSPWKRGNGGLAPPHTNCVCSYVYRYWVSMHTYMI
jgi:hypothetical protein